MKSRKRSCFPNFILKTIVLPRQTPDKHRKTSSKVLFVFAFSRSKLGIDFLHFGSDAYWLGNYTRTGSGFNQTHFVPTTPQQQFGPGPGEGHGYYSGARNAIFCAIYI